jgi:CheY-like chemotaxis protein
MKFLLVDDHAPFRHMVRSFLPDTNPIVVECCDGAEALASYKNEKPDWVIMDIEMPVMDGLEAAKRMKEWDPSSRIIMLTQYDDPELRQAAADAGVYRFLLKDNLADLEQAIDACTCEEKRSSAKDKPKGIPSLTGFILAGILSVLSTTSPIGSYL